MWGDQWDDCGQWEEGACCGEGSVVGGAQHRGVQAVERGQWEEGISGRVGHWVGGAMG